MFKKTLLSVTLGSVVFGQFARADGDYVPPVKHALTQEECSACHMAFPPAFLPARSWSKIMNTLEDHFGEDASLDETSRQEIEDYLATHAADAGNRSSRFLRSIAGTTPMRITDLGWWQREHNHEVSQRMWDKAGSKSNCTACHRGAERGYFDDD